MGTFKCYWPGGPLDPYRRACLASYGRYGHSLELVCERRPAELPPGVTIRTLEATKAGSLLEAQLIGSTDRIGITGGWVPSDWLLLRAQTSSPEPNADALAWVEAFKLWLPEFAPELRQRASQWDQLPLHLSCAALTGINLHYLPPEQSFLAEVLARQQDDNEPLPWPHHDTTAIREKIKAFLTGNQNWLLEPLKLQCGTSILIDLGLTSRPTIRNLVKNRFKRLAMSIKHLISS